MNSTQFASRVRVFSLSGNLLFVLHAEGAARTLKEIVAGARAGEESLVRASHIRKRARGRIIEITVPADAPGTHKPPTAPSLSQYMGQKYTITERTKNAAGEVDGRVCQHKYIHPGDRPLFRLSVTDCMRA